ncbi:MAG: 1-deoxy-D-xylulose-5-phosphate reductoisomerase [Spirochaetaceae bacterium]|nr:1-deoxy-D-xylulose-5-phosphate reductoisomerase [Spirochaetaceae bacterium]
MKKLIILGATGSVGRQAIEVVKNYPDLLKVVGLAAYSNKEELIKLTKFINVDKLALAAENPAAITNLIKESDADVVLNAISGSAGLLASFTTLEEGRTLALANKESMVMAGPLLKELAAKNNCLILPVDSEHSALFFLLQNRKAEEIDELILTASGGPFRDYSFNQLRQVTAQQAANHPTWQMGAKISIDSASLANKGLEVIEAWQLFNIDIKKIKVVMHRQSVVHSFIRTTDGALYGQMGKPTMLLPIQNALLYPALKPVPAARFDLFNQNLTFEAIDNERFPLLNLAYRACELGAAYPLVYNIANEIAVADFCAGRIKFTALADYVEQAFNHSFNYEASKEGIFKLSDDIKNFFKG